MRGIFNKTKRFLAFCLVTLILLDSFVGASGTLTVSDGAAYDVATVYDAASENNETGDDTSENTGTGDGVSENPETGDVTPENPETNDGASENPETGDGASENTETGDAGSENTGTSDAAPENNETDDAASENNETGDAASENSETDGSASENPETGDAASENSETDGSASENPETGDAASENNETGDAAPENNDVQDSVQLLGEEKHNPKVTMSAGDYDAENGVIAYTVVVEAEGDMDYTVTQGEDETSKQYPVVIEDLTSVAESDLVFVSGSYTYEHHKELADELPQSEVNAEAVTSGATDFTGFPLTVAHMYDGDIITLSYTAYVLSATYIGAGQAATQNAVTIYNNDGTDNNPANDSADDSDTVSSAFSYKPLEKTRTALEGSWATWSVKVNPKGFKLNGGNPLTLRDTFALTHKDESGNDVSDQSIDYASIKAVPADDVTYDYRGNTGSFVIPDGVSVTISYRTRITAQPGEEVIFGNYAELLDSNETQIDKVELSQTETIFPSASEVDAASGVYMLKLYVYGDGNMQTGIPGAQFILLDANGRPMSFKKGDNAGDAVIFTTGDDGYADIRLDEESGDVSIQKNTAYYLEMIKVPSGYKRDNTLYNFMITDDPNYNSGGAWTYFNGDTIKVRLYAEEASLNVSLRFSGNYSLNSNQQNAVEVILQRKTEENGWEEVERHPYTEFSYGSLTFDAAKDFELDETYRVIQENQRPWDLGSAVILNTTYYLIIGAGDSQQDTNPQEFTLTERNIESSFNIVIDNEYEEPKLTLTKMDKETGETLSGAVFTVKRAGDDAEMKTYTTGKNGEIVISGGAPFQSETLYYVVETTPPAGYLLPLNPEKLYFYFCNDDYFIPTILRNLPEGETAVNLSETYENQTVDNQKERLTIPVMATWQGNAWPGDVKNVTIGLYQSVGDATPEPVLDENDEAMTVVLSGTAPYNNHAFTNLPARDDQNQPIVYSIREERIDNKNNNDILESYVQEYGVSDSGVYIVRNKPATTLTVNKEWYDFDGEKVRDDETLAKQPNVTFDIYRTTEKLPDEMRADGVTNEEMSAFISDGDLTKARSGVSFGHADGWTTSVRDLDKYSDDNKKPYYYYVLETIPSFGDETYALTEADAPNYATHTVTISNKIAPETVSVTVRKAPLVNDPRPEAPNTDFGFTLTLKKGSYVIRGYQVRDDLVTDWNGKATFTLKPENPLDPLKPGTSIDLTLPVGVTATITEAVNPEYVVEAESDKISDLDTENGRVFQFEVEAANNNALITYTATLRVICKVTGVDGKETPFESLKSALAYIRDHEAFYHKKATIWVLEDYEKPDTDIFDVREDEDITLTTAPTEAEEPEAEFHFKTARDENTDTAVISRGGDNGSMFTNDGVLSLEKIILDGANVADAADGEDATNAAIIMDGDGGLVYNTGTLNLSENTTLRNSSVSGKGGAVYSEGVVNMRGGAVTGNSATSGAAFYLESGALTMTGGVIRDNTAADDGAVTVYNPEVKVNLSNAPVIFDNRNVDGEWANIYIGADSDNIINVVAPGLSSDAKIGVRAMETHREIGEQFATAEFEMTDNLTCFVNDQYEYRGKLKDGTSTNIVWDGLTLTIKKVVDPVGANANDRFTLTLTSTSIRKSNYIIDGSVDYTITAAKRNTPGSIVLRNVKNNDNIIIASLPVGEYTIEEEASNYSSVYTGVNHELNQELTIDNGGFSLQGDSGLTVTSVRRMATVNLTKTMRDRLKTETETQKFNFSLKLTDADGTPVSAFALTDGMTTDTSGVVRFAMSPSNDTPDKLSFKVPVGATMRIEETENEDYQIITSAQTMPKEETEEETEGETEEKAEEGTEEATGIAIEDTKTENDNIFVFPVTDDGANVTFSNVRKIAVIELSKELENKVSATESFTFTVTLTRKDEAPAAGYVMYEDTENPENNITADENGQATVIFQFPEDVSSQSVTLIIPDGAKLEVKETPVKKTVDGAETEIYGTVYSVNGGEFQSGATATINSVSSDTKSIAFRNVRKTQTVTVKNTVSGYSGNTEPFTFTATVTDGAEGEDDYDANGFTDGKQVFQLATGETKNLVVPYGATFKVAETFVVGYETRNDKDNDTSTPLDTEFTVTKDETVSFTNTQLINLVVENKCSLDLADIQVYVSASAKMYRVNEARDGQEAVTLNNRTATVTVKTGETAILAVEYKDNQTYKISGDGHTDYYMTIVNEPSYPEDANPAIMRVYNDNHFEVSGKLRYGPADSTVAFTEQPLVSFDVNGGVWTTEMDGYNDRDGDRKVYQVAVNVGEKAPQPGAPVYPTAENIAFLGWTLDKEFAEESHTAGEDISGKEYNFDNPVNEPLTLYAVWTREARNTRIVTVKNACNEPFTFTVTLSNADAPGNYALADDVTTDDSGQASFALSANATKNLSVSNGATLELTASGDCIAYSTDFADADNVDRSFTINPVKQDGVVSFISGVCKITDADGNTLYQDGNPAVYKTLSEAFAAYGGTFDGTSATPAAVKMLVDEYHIRQAAALNFPNADMTLTTADSDDESFPYVGARTRATIYRYGDGASYSCFYLTGGTVTLTDIILDGGSTLTPSRKAEIQTNGGLINVSGGTLNITDGATLRNCEMKAYSDGGWGRGGAVYLTGGALNMTAGQFSNCHARSGGAIYATASANLLIRGVYDDENAEPGVQFVDCSATDNYGGAIYKEYNTAETYAVIDGGANLDKPGVSFLRCTASSTNPQDKSRADEGGAISMSGANATVSIRGTRFVECISKDMYNDRQFGGGAIRAKTVASLTVEYCSFEDCLTRGSGSAVMVVTDSFTMAHCTVKNCDSGGQGGAVATYPKNEGSNYRSEILIEDCHFANTSSGTGNGSGGAIQTYMTYVTLKDCSFTDCWAGKEGGAMNHVYKSAAAGDEKWPSQLIVDNCTFKNCRAEDRYQPTAVQHYGGGICTKAQIVEVKDSSFENCVSTLKQGGALFCNGRGVTAGASENSQATITNTTFKDCSAKMDGGAVFAQTNILLIDGTSSFENCTSSSKGGAVSHNTAIGNSSPQRTLISANVSFTGCAATHISEIADSGNGGAIWTRAAAEVSLMGCVISNCSATLNGGGVYLSKNGSASLTATIRGGSIKECQANNGSAVYVQNRAIFSGVEITDNTVFDINSGAVHGGILYFEGNVKVEDNACSADSVYMHDVLLQNNNVTTIYTTDSGLGEQANVGVYVSDSNNAYKNRGQEGQAFGTHGTDNGTDSHGANYLDAFFNDRDESLFGYKKDESDSYIYWGAYVCKITDKDGNTLTRSDGRDAVYQRLTMAFDDFTKVSGGDPVYVKMLVEEYKVKQTGQIENFPEANVTLTTASTSEPDDKYPYRGVEGTVCTISRDNSTSQLFKLNKSGATFQLENITLDGRKDKTTAQGNYRLIEAASGKLIINGGTTMQYGYASPGAAINAQNNDASVEINGAYDAEKASASVKFLNCVSTDNGGAIFAKSLRVNGAEKYGAAFTNCSANSGGAIYVSGMDAEINGAVFTNCHSANEGGAVFHNNSDNTTAYTTIRNCSFTNCYANPNAQNANGGAVCSRTATLTVESSGFVNCYALLNGGAINHGAGQSNRLQTIIVNSTFDHCETTGNNGYGGSVYTSAKEIELTNCSVNNSVSVNHGGALYCQSNDASSKATISGSSFDSCSVTQSEGIGGAIYSRNHELTIGDSVINACVAPKYSGAVYMETDKSVLNISDGAKISGCYANQGGAIYLKKGVTLNLTGSPEFTQNGYTTRNGSVVDAEQGACIYLAGGSKINLSGAPKFSRNYLNNLTRHPRITNGSSINYVRQDLYLAEYAGKHAESIHVAGELTGDTIWVWPEQSPHRLHDEQFATTELSVSSASLGKFRNALADTETGCSYGEYLAGMRLADKEETDVYWNKVYNISFNKKDNKGEAVAGAEFTLYTDSACSTKFLSAVSADGEEDTNVEGELLNKGVVDFTAVPIGVYYMRETIVPESFRAEDIPYLVLVGSPSLAPNENNTALWHNGGPLDVYNAATLVLRYTMDSGKYFGIFPVENGKATLRGNIASPNMGIINIRNNYDISFMKTDTDMKTDTEGKPLQDAEFTIYAPILDGEGKPKLDGDNNNYPEMTRYLRDGEEYPPVKSADDKTKYNGATVAKGLVCFRDLPKGSYYLVESYYPGRNGDDRIAYFVESDRVFKLDVNGKDDFTLSEWNTDGTFTECATDSANKYYVVGNTQAVCKLTDANGNLLYERSLSGRVNPAIYATLEEGFEAAQSHILYDKDGNIVINADSVAALKLQVLKDVSLSFPVTYNNSKRDLTFTTASTNPTKDRYKFNTTNTDPNERYRAEIKRAYNADTSSNANAGALITVADGAKLTLQNINLNGQKSEYNGRAIHVTQGSLTIQNSVKIQNFKQEAKADSTDENDVKGGAVLLDDNTTLTVNGVAEFSNNAVLNHRSEGATGADGGAIAVGKNCTVSFSNVQFLNNQASSASEKAGNGGAVSLNEATDAENPTELSFTNAVFKYNSASYQGGALFTAEKYDLTVKNGEFTNNTAGDGGAIAALSKEDAPSTLRIIGGVFKSNSANGGDGGAVKIGGYGTLSMSGSLTISENSAKNGGAVIAAPYAKVTFASGTMSGNSATEGSAFYMEDNASLTVSGGTVDGNKASGDNGGAINAGGANAKLYFSGSPCVFNNTSATDSNQQRNVVLGYNSNGLINSATDGLNANALIGVYVIGGTREDLFKAHGLPGAPFGTFGDTDKLNPQVFRNDRNLALYGVKNEADDEDALIYWSDVICKLTDTDDNLLYQDIRFIVNRQTVTCKAPAVYTSVQDGFNAAQGTLYSKNNSAYTGFTSDNQLKMLKDAALSASVNYTGKRAVTFTTAETNWDELKSEDCFLFKTNRNSADGTDLTKALITRATAFKNGSMIKATGKELTLTSITLDGMKDSITATGNGGIVYVYNGARLTIQSDAILQNSAVTGNGGIVYVANGAGLTIQSGAVLQNSAVTGKGGAAYIANGGVATVTGGEINHNESDGDGAGFYLEKDSKLYLSGNPNFGGKGTDASGNILYNNGGNWKKGDLTGVKNGDKTYTKARQDIFIAGYEGNDDSVSADSLIVNGNITSGDGSIWVWAEKAPRYKTMCQFGKFQGSITNLDDSLKAFRNARDDETTGYEPNPSKPSYVYLEGVTGDESGCIYWCGDIYLDLGDVICKLTDADDNLLYRNISITVNGKSITRKAPAVYTSVQGGFDAAQGTLYARTNGAYTEFTSDNLKLKMLKDAALSASVNYTGNRAVTFTTAEANEADLKSGDTFPFKTNRKNADGNSATEALITRAFKNGSMIKATGKELTLSSITLDGMKDSITATGDGGIVYVYNGARLTIQSGAILQNSAVTGNGGAAYIANGGTATVTGGEINHNESDGDGAGFYLEKDSKLYLSGNPNFGGKGTDASGNILYNNGGNWKKGDLTGVKNGNKTYTKARQDIFIAGYAGNDNDVSADSLIVNGDITSPDESIPVDGSIWVWAEETPHYETMKQFGKYTGSDAPSGLNAFRNARDDKTTRYEPNPSYAYLDGVTGDEPGCIYWYGEDMTPNDVGGRTVILRKTNDNITPLKDAKFKLYQGASENLMYERGPSGENGVFFAEYLQYGTYYLLETQAPAGYSANEGKWFWLIVKADGVLISQECFDTYEDARANTPNV